MCDPWCEAYPWWTGCLYVDVFCCCQVWEIPQENTKVGKYFTKARQAGYKYITIGGGKRIAILDRLQEVLGVSLGVVVGVWTWCRLWCMGD